MGNADACKLLCDMASVLWLLPLIFSWFNQMLYGLKQLKPSKLDLSGVEHAQVCNVADGKNETLFK